MHKHLVVAAVLSLVACSSKGGPGAGSTDLSATPITVASATSSARVKVDDKDGFVVVDLPAASGEVTAVVHAEAVKAKGRGLRPFVEFAAAWCEPCQAIKNSLDDPKMRSAFKGTYIIRLDADDWGEHLGGSGFAPRAIPIFYEVDDAGKPTGRTIDGGAWADNVPANMAPALDGFFHKS